MKKQALIIASLTIALLLSQTGLSNDLLLFLLVGAVPGTGYNLSSNTMLTLVGLATWFVAFRFRAIRALQAQATRQVIKHYETTKARFPKRRFGQI
jgi:hypothetical protein